MRQIEGFLFTKEGNFQYGTVTVENGVIKEVSIQDICDEANAERGILEEEIQKRYILPGLVDIHFHGCKGYDFCDGTVEAVHEIAKYEAEHGITSICPATMTLSKEQLVQICRAAAEAEEKNLVGINLEGPFIAEAKKGAQNGKYIKKADGALLECLQECSDGKIKLVTIAPEEEGAIDCIKAYGDQFQFSIGHTCADYETAKEAMEAGANHVTHLYNAMPGFTHRAPGVVGAAFDQQDTMVELICDGIHIHPSMVRATFQLFGPNRVILISDSMMATGMESGEYALGGQKVNVKGNLATLEDGTLAGSVTNLYDCMVNAVHMGIPLETAVGAATVNPARSIGLEEKIGVIAVGRRADLLVVDEKLKLLEVLKG